MGKELKIFLERLETTQTVKEKKEIQTRFDELADYLMNKLCIAVNDKHYRIVEIEMYYYHKDKHADPYVHGYPEQLNCGTWYFHYSGLGLDITFGNKEKNIYGGILIRSIKELDENPKYINGPFNVLKEIFPKMTIETGGKGICIEALQEKHQKEFTQKDIYIGKRIGLTKEALDRRENKRQEHDKDYVKKEDPKRDYENIDYRYIVEKNEPNNKVKKKTEVKILDRTNNQNI